MFFQRADRDTRPAKSFVLIPGVPNLRLGLSSRMNMGDPLEGGRAQLLQDHAELVTFVPYGARVVKVVTRSSKAYWMRLAGSIRDRSRDKRKIGCWTDATGSRLG